MPLDHHHAPGVTLEQVVDEWDDDDDPGRRCSERETREAFDETGNKGGR